MKKLILIFCVFFIALCLNGQDVKKGFKHLEKLDYARAEEAFGKELILYKENPALNFGLAMVYGDKESPYYDLIKAWSCIRITMKNLSALSTEETEIIGEYFTNTEERRSSRSVDKKIEHAAGALEAELIRYIREENNLDLAYEIINKFPDYRHYDNVVHLRNQLEFRKYEKQNTLAGYLEFTSRFPDAAQVGKAWKYIEQLAFNEVKRTNTVEAYEAYMKKYPNSVQYSAAVKGRNAAAYASAKRTNTLKAYEDFINKYPEALEIAEAKVMQKQLLYEQAKRIQTLEAYNEFIKKYPEGTQYIDIFNLKSLDLGMKFLGKNNLEWTNILWARSFDNDKNKEQNGGLAITSDNNYIIATSTLQEDSLYNDAWIVRVGADGKMIWNKMIGSRFEDNMLRVAVNTNNDIITAGYTWLSPDSASREVWAFKIDPEGKKIWNRSLGKWEITSLLINGNNEIFIGGYINNDSVNHYSLIVINDEGRKLWKRTYTGVGEINSLALAPDNNIVMAGSRWAAKMTPKGYLLWEAVFDPADSITGAAVSGTGEVYFAGIRNSENPVLYKYSAAGYRDWAKEYESFSDVERITDVICYGDRVFISGSTVLQSFIQTFNTAGTLISMKPLPHGVVITDIATDKSGNLLIELLANDILIIKNSGINL
jgi:tetratricopeptide (TPR) repeat protein